MLSRKRKTHDGDKKKKSLVNILKLLTRKRGGKKSRKRKSRIKRKSRCRRKPKRTKKTRKSRRRKGAGYTDLAKKVMVENENKRRKKEKSLLLQKHYGTYADYEKDALDQTKPCCSKCKKVEESFSQRCLSAAGCRRSSTFTCKKCNGDLDELKVNGSAIVTECTPPPVKD